MKNFSALVCLLCCLIVAPSYAANEKPSTAKVAAKAPAKESAKTETTPAKSFNDASEDVDVEETASGQRMVSVSEMPANQSGEVATRQVRAPESFGRTEKPAVKDLPALPKAGLVAGGIAFGAMALLVFEVLKFAAVAFAIVWLVRHLFPSAAARADKASGKLRQVTGIKQIGGVGETVKQFDTAVAELRKKHRAHSGLAAFMETRLSQFSPAPPAATKKAKKTNVVGSTKTV